MRLERALELTHEWQRVDDPETLPERVLRDLLALIGADAAGWNETGPGPHDLRIVSVPEERLALDPSLLAERLHENPFVDHVSDGLLQQAVTFSDFVTRRELQRRELYQVFYRPLGVEYQLAGAVDAGPPLVVVAFNRQRRDFGPEDRRLLDLVRPHVAAAYRACLARAEARRRLEALEHGLASLAGSVIRHVDGWIEQAGEGALEVVERWFGSRERLPGSLLAVEGELVLQAADSRLQVRPVAGAPGLLLLDERRLDSMEARGRRLGLTAREAQIVAAVALERTSREIADELGISVRTVHKHLEHAFAKLGVSGRRAAAAALATG
jgi:DNA-binding CsgD family transcriptional regulator